MLVLRKIQLKQKAKIKSQEVEKLLHPIQQQLCAALRKLPWEKYECMLIFDANSKESYILKISLILNKATLIPRKLKEYNVITAIGAKIFK